MFLRASKTVKIIRDHHPICLYSGLTENCNAELSKPSLDYFFYCAGGQIFQNEL